MSTDEALDSLSFGFTTTPTAPPQVQQEVGFRTLVAVLWQLIN